MRVHRRVARTPPRPHFDACDVGAAVECRGLWGLRRPSPALSRVPGQAPPGPRIVWQGVTVAQHREGVGPASCGACADGGPLPRAPSPLRSPRRHRP